MAVELGPAPLLASVSITQEGFPTPFFMRQWDQIRVASQDIVSLNSRVTILEGEVDNIQAVDIVAGTGLDGGGNISGPADVTLNLEDTAVTPGTYGDASNVPQFTVDQQGRLTAVSNIPITSGFPGYLVTGEDNGAGPEFVSNGDGLPMLLE